MESKNMKVIVDSTCDLPKDLVDKYDIDIVPVYVNYEGKTYADREEITADEFYNVLREADELPKTSAPSPKDFLDKITKYTKEYSSIFIATLTSKLSATYQSAKIAAKRIKDKQIHVIDSLFGSGVLAFLSLAAAKLSRKGIPEEEIVKKVETIRDESILLGYVDTLDNLKKGGRISNLKYYVANLMKAKPLLELKEGVLHPIGSATGKEKAQEKVISEVLKRIKKDTKYDIMVTHGDDLESAEKIMKILEREISFGEKIINYLTPALAVHLGIGTIVVSISPSPI
ncbi:MAG: DegV family protein [Candidatus Heimdallarchaeaceae archaeon]|jgi:DegV family protein with EDD domain